MVQLYIMLDIKFIAENSEKVKEKLALRSGSYDIDGVLKLEKTRRKIIKEAESLKAVRNLESESIAKLLREKNTADAEVKKEKVKEIGARIKVLDDKLSKTEKKLQSRLLSIPNIPHESIPAGKNDTDNAVMRVVGEPRKFDFVPQAHWDIGEKLGLLDWPRAAKISGARFTVYRGLAARLERSLISFMLDTHAAAGYTEILPPYIVNRDSMTGTGQLPKFEEDMFALKNTNYYLIPTAEVPVTNLHRDEILEEANLPIHYCAYSACFRAEAGSAGRDTRGLIRQHQFNKVELVKFCSPEKSYDELEALTANAEQILKLLGIPYRVVLLCTGDMGFSSAKTYDIEVWMPSYNRYVEISSCSNFEDFQARRANIKYKAGKESKAKHLHTLNGSGLAIGRTVAAVLENYQNADGTVAVPEALKKYMNTDLIK